ncbi:MAG: dGTPase [Gammaproteobacteria bacterium]|jgi:dGTPase|nr:dGTPase [Gammaproteobacteria bacterium]
MTLDYRSKLKPVRFRESSVQGRDFNEEMESDRGRAINSAAVRRLQQKTQVFPLEINAAVRSRLTHSMEVQQVGRHISKTILSKLAEQQELAITGLDKLGDGFISAVEIACLLHDVGNPPFGHFGEEAIKVWAQGTVAPLFSARFAGQTDYLEYQQDLCQFEGNAQGLRILHSLQTLNLTYTQLACLFKYTRIASKAKPDVGSEFAYRHKKPGYYLSEQTLYTAVSEALDIGPGCRFPLVYIMEAADDISYCIADLADALDKGILTVPELNQAIEDQWQQLLAPYPALDQNYLPAITQAAMAAYGQEAIDKNHEYMLTLRTNLVNDLVEQAAQHYVDNHKAVFTGTFDGSLIEGRDVYSLAAKVLKKVAVSRVFCTREVEDLELKGYAVITGLLDKYALLLGLSSTQMRALVTSSEQSLKGFPIETRLYHKLSGKHKRTYLAALHEVFAKGELKDELSEADAMLEFYYRVRLLIDYISGMTDNFALAEYQLLTAS